MSLITINADFRELVAVMREIRDILLRAFPPKKVSAGGPMSKEAFFELDPETEWQREQEEEARNIGQTAARE